MDFLGDFGCDTKSFTRRRHGLALVAWRRW